MSHITINNSKFSRSEVISHIIFPLKPLQRDNTTDSATLADLVRNKPSELEALGLERVHVFAPSCSDPEAGTWHVAKHSVWVDKETRVPLDSATVQILGDLPNDLSTIPSRIIIELLPPTYCAYRRDAEVLVALLIERGPMHQWSVEL